MIRTMHALPLGAALAFSTGCSDPTTSASAAGDTSTTPGPAVSVLATQLAASGKPTREPIPDDAQRFDAPAGVVCSFELAGDPVANNEFVTTFPARPNGDIVVLVTGRLVDRLSNVETGESITLNISGPLRFTFHPDGTGTTELLGRSVVFLFPNNGGPSTFLNAGRTVFTFAPGEPAILVFVRGHQEDICAALS